jgi:hypothetical protein
MSRYYRSFLEESTIPYTTRTTAFATATGITDTTILGALNTFDLGLISNGLDTKMKALYPFVGGTATTHQFNFMDARDLNAAFRLTFSGGMTHSSNGVQFGGVNGTADTYLVPSATLGLNSTSAGIYSRTNNASSIADLSNTDGSSNFYAPNMYIRFGGTAYYCVNTSGQGTIANPDSLGFYLTNRIDSAQHKLHKNGALFASENRPSTSLANGTIVVGRIAGGYFSDRQYAFMTIGLGLTDAEALNLYTLTQAFQTTLGRQV